MTGAMLTEIPMQGLIGPDGHEPWCGGCGIPRDRTTRGGLEAWSDEVLHGWLCADCLTKLPQVSRFARAIVRIHRGISFIRCD